MRKHLLRMGSRYWPLLIVAVSSTLLAAGSALRAQSPEVSRAWWIPGISSPLPAEASFANEHGRFGLINDSGPIDTRGHPFFAPLGANGRACVSCHQPADAMSLSLTTIRERWDATGGSDPLFAAVDGKNCPHLPQGESSGSERWAPGLRSAAVCRGR